MRMTYVRNYLVFTRRSRKSLDYVTEVVPVSGDDVDWLHPIKSRQKKSKSYLVALQNHEDVCRQIADGGVV